MIRTKAAVTDPVAGDIRTRSYFAWLPITINSDETSETRWLRRVEVEEVFCKGKDIDGDGYAYWYPICFTDSKKYSKSYLNWYKR